MIAEDIFVKYSLYHSLLPVSNINEQQAGAKHLKIVILCIHVTFYFHTTNNALISVQKDLTELDINPE